MKRSCFTLVELLVVITVIILLLAIIIPVLTGVRQRTRALVCTTRIRQVTLDLTMYDTDNKTFPYSFKNKFSLPPGGHVGDASRDMVGWWWFHLMEGYTDTRKKKLYCPSKSLDNPGLNNCILYGNFGVNRSICRSPESFQKQDEFSGAPLCKDEIANPSRTLLILDCGYSVTSWWHATDIPPAPLDSRWGVNTAYIPGLAVNKDKPLMPGQDRDANDGRHPNKTVNVGFVGGNASRVHVEELFIEKRFDGYESKTLLWRPE